MGAPEEHSRAVKQHAADPRKRGCAVRLQAAFGPVIMFVSAEGPWEGAEEGQRDLLLDVLRLGLYPASPRPLGLVVELLRPRL